MSVPCSYQPSLTLDSATSSRLPPCPGSRLQVRPSPGSRAIPAAGAWHPCSALMPARSRHCSLMGSAGGQVGRQQACKFVAGGSGDVPLGGWPCSRCCTRCQRGCSLFLIVAQEWNGLHAGLLAGALGARHLGAGSSKARLPGPAEEGIAAFSVLKSAVSRSCVPDKTCGEARQPGAAEHEAPPLQFAVRSF